MASSARVQLCGPLVVEIDGRLVTQALPGRRGRMLVGFLAAHRRRAHAREELIDALWPEGPPAGAGAKLSALLSGARRALGAELVSGRAEVRLALPPDTYVDLEAAEEAIHRAQSAVDRGDWERAWAPSQVALFVARRGFLPEVDAAWAARWRQRVEEIHLSGLECLAASSLGLDRSEFATGEKAARELVAAAPVREQGHILLMRTLAARGNTAEALLAYEHLRTVLDEELGMVPGPESRALEARLRDELAHRPGARRPHPELLVADEPRPPADSGGTFTICFTDIVDSTRIAWRLGDRRWAALVHDHEHLIRSLAEANGGRAIKSQGDGMMLAFPSARSGATFALSLQRELARGGSAEELRVRAGLHTGEAQEWGGDYLGRAVIQAARISAVAQAGEVLVSALVRELLDTGGDFVFRDPREVELKGLPGKHLIWSIQFATPMG